MAFSVQQRTAARERVLEVARADDRISGGAITGSAAVGAEDRWSDIDLAFGLLAPVPPQLVLDEWTARLEPELETVHWWDLQHGTSVYRVFLLPGGLELDIALDPAEEFGRRGAKFQHVFGDRVPAGPEREPATSEAIGWGWVYALTARAAIARERLWAGEHWITAVRDQALTLACIRSGVPSEHARGVDRLPPALLEKYEEAFVRRVAAAELRRALAASIELYLDEVGQIDRELATRLADPLREAVRDLAEPAG